MKNLVVVTMAMMMIVSMFFATGCAKQPKKAAGDWYTAVPEKEHMRRFPEGHKEMPGPEGENCVYNEKTGAYFCQFDWFE